MAFGNATLQQAAANGVLLNDTLNGGTISEFDAATTAGGTVALAADGSFTYTPPFDFSGSDSFTYTLENSVGESTATVTLNVNNKGWFVDNSLATNGNGSQASPFNNLTDALGRATAGDTIFVFAGGPPITGPIVVPEGVNLVGEGAGLVIAQTIEEPGQQPTLEAEVRLLGSNRIAGFLFQDSPDAAIVAQGVRDITIEDNTFRGSEDEHIYLENINGTVNILNNTLEELDDGEDYLYIYQHTTNATFNLTGNSFTNTNDSDADDAMDIEVFGTSIVTFNVTGNTVSNAANQSTGIENGLGMEIGDDAQVTLNMSGSTPPNTFTNVEDHGVFIEPYDESSVAITIADCIIDNADEQGIDIDVGDGCQATVAISNNTIEDSGSQGLLIDLPSDPATLTGTISGNIIRSSGEEGVLVYGGSEGPILTFSGNNQIIDSEIAGIHVIADTTTGGDGAVLTLDGNTIQGTDGDGIWLESTGDDRLVVFLLNNSILTSVVDSILTTKSGSATFCLDIAGNTVDRDMRFDDTSDNNGIGVELFASFAPTLNNFQNGSAPVEESTGNDVEELNDGDCQALLAP